MASFTAELAVWNGEEGDEDCDTLILTASADAASPYAFRWDFTGDVYKTLLSSGVQYLVLRVGERVTALSTAGFTAGTAYNTLKSEGAASSEFAYSLWMGDPDRRWRWKWRRAASAICSKRARARSWSSP